MRTYKTKKIANPVVQLIAAGLFGLGAVTSGAAVAGSKDVIELYTSQGCSSCPPADDLMSLYADKPDLVVLTLPVTYWDYLGWKDTYAQQGFTDRQYNYARLRGDRSVYTPQAVVNGRGHAVGSDKRAIDRLLRDTGPKVDVSVAFDNENLTIDVTGGTERSDAVIWIALFQRSGTVSVARGENRNRRLTYTNIVREMRPIGKWYGKDMKVDLPKEDVMGKNIDGIAVIVQDRDHGLPGAILGADYWMEKPSS